MSLRGFFNDLLLGGTCRVRTGTGSPEGSVTAGVGSLYLRTDGSGGTVLYVKESGASNTGWVAMASASSLTSGLVKQSTTTLTDAQIKALPTTGITLLAAPGASLWNVPVMWTWQLNSSAGAYTNIDTGYSALQVTYDGDTTWASTAIANDGTIAKLTGFLGAAAARVFLTGPYFEGADAGSSAGTAEYNFGLMLGASVVTNKALKVSIDNNGTGNLTGGNAANTLTIRTYYITEAI